LFVKHFRRPEPLSEKDPVNFFNITSPTEKELHAIH